MQCMYLGIDKHKYEHEYRFLTDKLKGEIAIHLHLDIDYILAYNIIEDYDRMIRIILLTTIPCTHLDIVHSSQYV